MTVASFYFTLFDAVLRNHNLSHGWHGFYYVTNDEYTWYSLSKKIGEALVALGKATEAEPTSFTLDELPRYFWTEKFGWLWGTNCRVRASRGIALGWKPRYKTKDLMAFIRPEVESVIAAQAQA